MLIEDCRVLVEPGMKRVDDLIRSRLASDVVLVNQLSNYIIHSGGKRLRPQLVLLAAGAVDYSGEHHIDIAAIIEFIHTATLLHDDVVDASDLRRGRNTANSVWGNDAAVLVGDFLYSRAFEMMVTVDSMRVMEILAGATNRIAEGEVMQLMNVNEPDVSESDYIEVIRAKTARLFEAATRLAGVLAGADHATESALAAYGEHLGTAFQITDDVLDYVSDEGQLGKEVGDDLAEGKPTLPLILAMKLGNESQSDLIREAIAEGGRERIGEVLKVVNDTGALAASTQQAKQEAERAVEALATLPPSAFNDALAVVARYSVERLS